MLPLNNLSIKIKGKSHSKELKLTLSNYPKGIKFDKDFFEQELKRRRPTTFYETKRKEEDKYFIISGFKNNISDGNDINIVFENNNINKDDYIKFKDQPRPGHTDFISYLIKNKIEDGSGIFSGRMTVLFVAAGALAKLATNYTYKSSIKNVSGLKKINNLNKYLKKIGKKKDSAGAKIEIIVDNVSYGLGSPLFDKATSIISYMLFSVPGVKGVYFGNDFILNNLKGSNYNDLYINKEGKTLTNNQGGFSGGITNGNPLIINVYLRPASSIGIMQKTYNLKTNKLEKLIINGRHDTFYQKRAIVVLESVIALSLLDLELSNKKKIKA